MIEKNILSLKYMSVFIKKDLLYQDKVFNLGAFNDFAKNVDVKRLKSVILH